MVGLREGSVGEQRADLGFGIDTLLYAMELIGDPIAALNGSIYGHDRQTTALLLRHGNGDIIVVDIQVIIIYDESVLEIEILFGKGTAIVISRCKIIELDHIIVLHLGFVFPFEVEEPVLGVGIVFQIMHLGIIELDNLLRSLLDWSSRRSVRQWFLLENSLTLSGCSQLDSLLVHSSLARRQWCLFGLRRRRWICPQGLRLGMDSTCQYEDD